MNSKQKLYESYWPPHVAAKKVVVPSKNASVHDLHRHHTAKVNDLEVKIDKLTNAMKKNLSLNVTPKRTYGQSEVMDKASGSDDLPELVPGSSLPRRFSAITKVGKTTTYGDEYDDNDINPWVSGSDPTVYESSQSYDPNREEELDESEYTQIDYTADEDGCENCPLCKRLA